MSSYHHGNLRAALLARAAEVIAADGIEALSLRGLARDIGVSPAAPSRHFNGRVDLLASLAATGYREATEIVLAVSKDDDPRPRPAIMAEAFVAWTQDNPALFAAISHPDVARHADAALIDALRHFADALRVAITTAQAEGWRKDQDPEVLLHFALAAIRGLTINLSDPQFLAMAGAPTDEQIVRVIERMFAD